MSKLLTKLELRTLKGIDYSRQHLWALERQDKFPRRVTLGPRSIYWDEDEIDAYLEKKKAARPAPPSPLPPPPRLRPFRRVKRRA
jgi:predicted DNA-binding transcriptional regulator AlpA